jgi:hypothetical protein
MSMSMRYKAAHGDMPTNTPRVVIDVMHTKAKIALAYWRGMTPHTTLVRAGPTMQVCAAGLKGGWRGYEQSA